MPTNEQIILNEVLSQQQLDIDPNLPASEFFELFTCEQILKDHDLSYEEIESGLVGDGGDGGVDGFYLFINGELVDEDPDFSRLRKNVRIDLVLVQSKLHAGFQETPIERFISVTNDILDLSKPPSDLKGIYNSHLIDGISRFRKVQQQLAARFPILCVQYNYATKGVTPSKTVKRKVEALEKAVKTHFPNANFLFQFLGALELLELARKAPQATFSLGLAENPISAEGQVGYICLVRLRDFFNFISDGQGQLLRSIFDANVRDYQGRTEVNDAIQEALIRRNPEDFWWLNNGVTVLATKASQTGKTLTIEDPQIVNGLQTSTEIFTYLKNSGTDSDERSVLVRVIVPEKSETRDRVIKANNSQTSVQLASLRATDKIHRDIEEYLRPRGLYYDRRKNYHKNEGKPRDKIISITQLAQAVMSVVLRQPDNARARPTSLLKKDDTYKKVFNSKFPIEVFHVCAEALRRVEVRLKSSQSSIPARDRNNLKFYVLLHSLACLTGTSNPKLSEIKEIDLSKLTDAIIDDSIQDVGGIFHDLGATDQVAKGSELVSAMITALGEKLASS